MISIVLSFFYVGIYAQQQADYDQVMTTTLDSDQPKKEVPQPLATHNQDDDRQVAEMAITTLASMAHNIINIGADAHNPQVIGSNVISILGSFVHFVTYALRNPRVVDLLKDEVFQDTVRIIIARSIINEQLDVTDDEII